MPKLIALGTSWGNYEVSQRTVKQFVYNLFSESGNDIDRLITIFDNSFINKRHFCMPLEWFGEHHSFSERNKLFVSNAIELSTEAIKNCLSKTNVKIKDIDNIIFISTTGLSTPSIDAILLNKLNFQKHIVRTPIWGLGCAGGAVGLSRAMDFTNAYPEKTSLVISLELCSLTFQKNDLSKSNIVACSLFSDGAAAAMVVGDESNYSSERGVKLLSSLSTTYRDSLDVMGWDIIDDGFKVLFRKDIPNIVTELVKPNIDELLCSNGLSLDQIKHYVTHPGGFKVINAYENSIGLKNGKLKYSRKVLCEHGNMSSPTVMFVLNEFMESDEFLPDEMGLISSLGPGFSSELILFRTS